MRMQNEEQELIIAKFNRYGLRITPKSLEKTISWLNENPNNSINILMKKLSQLALQNSSIDQNVQHAIQILSVKNKNLASYEDLLQVTRKKCIYVLSPYQKNVQTFFAQRPNPCLFQFRPEQKQKNHLNQFKRITDSNKQMPKDCIIGVIFQNFSALTIEGKQKIIMQNEVNQVELSFPKDFNPQCILYSGCAYIAKGKQEGKDLSFKVEQMILPVPPLQDKNSLLKMKFKQMCQNISSAKQTVGYQPYDFVKYDCVHNPSFQTKQVSLIFGNITINKESVTRIKRLIDAYPSGVSCVFLMLSAQVQEQIDLGLWLKCKVFIIPHIASDGPRLLPKLPLLKYCIPGAKILTNPAKISLQGKQFVLANYPLVRSILTQRITATSAPELEQNKLLTKVSDLIFSQGTIALGYDKYWPQTQYFNIHSESIVVVTDGVVGATYQKRQKAKFGGLSNTGNFDRDGDFLCVMTFAKQIVQTCGQM